MVPSGAGRVLSKEVREFVWKRAGGLCEECRSPGDWRGLQTHHKKPKRMGGSKRLDDPENLELLCADCHVRKHRL